MTAVLDRPLGLLQGNRARLVLTSGTLLFVELLLIRWVPAEVKYIGFFSNFLLMASFLGIGIGILLGRRRSLNTVAIFPIFLVAIVWMMTTLELNVQVVNSIDEIFFGLAESGAADVNFFVLPIVFALVTGLMASLAIPLGPLLRSMPPLQAYGWDITGSMLGIAGFTILSALGTNPVVWFAVVAILVTLLIIGSTDGTWLRIPAAAALAAVLFLAYKDLSPGEQWSSYYRINTYTAGNGEMYVNVNGIPHQALHKLNAPKEQFYDQLYKWFPDRTFPQALIVGAGSGTDVAITLAHGADHVDAVEIDRAIQQLGIDNHPDHPYQDPRVSRFENDGRAFLRGTDKKYDLIIFALPDSLTLVSSTANIRLESFLFTDEAFQSVRDHLTPDGVFVLYNYYRDEWLISKIDTMLADTFDSPPIMRAWEAHKAIFAAGPLIDSLNGGPPPGDGVDVVPTVGDPTPKEATDDWPFLYLRTPFIAGHYLAAIGFAIIVALLGVLGAARLGGTQVRRFSPHFFVLGSAFLLLETRSLVSFSLLFGSTWLVNALAFFAILASVLAAIFVNARLRIRRAGVLYGLLFVALAIAFVLPPESLLIDPPALRYLLAGLVAFAPVFLANLVFTYSFRDTRTADMAFASNLLGAMAGGALEYVALLTGYRALLIIVAALYLLAWLFATRWRRLADVDLASDEGSEPGSGSSPDSGAEWAGEEEAATV
ncbi:MAG TPA: fused MFS/spermidine synthase [Candidatus Limnocylindrales bacterium]|nr:fused MFS/spermidine synthase [Candidatus Limnocylindrales bacterium]